MLKEPFDCENIPAKLVADVRRQEPRFWLKYGALANILENVVTLLVSQPETSWLKAEAPENIEAMSVTLLVLKCEIG